MTTTKKIQKIQKVPKGWTEGTVQELLSLSDAEVAIVEMRLQLATCVRERRRAKRLTQAELAEKIHSTQPRVAKLEQAEGSLEMLLRALFALGTSRREVARLIASAA
jgi:ribosome-binding protein aMBF1 (putative translation factor)